MSVYILCQIATPPVPGTPPTFWESNSDKIIVAVITAIIILILSEPIKAGLRIAGGLLERGWQALGFGFEKRYRRALASGHRHLKLIGIYDKTALNPPRLQNVFISLRITSASAGMDAPRFGWERLFDDKERHLVILGQPGAGKTTLVDYLLLIFCAEIRHPLRSKLGAPLPMFARLRDLNIAGKSLLDVLQSPASTGLSSAPPTGYFERRLRQGECLVLLDGLDEVLDPAAHDRAVAEIRSFANEYAANRILVTCRVAGWNQQLPNFRVYEVQEFERDDIRKFIGAWYGEVERTAAVNALGPRPDAASLRQAESDAGNVALREADALWEALLAQEELLRIARTPLILSLITLVHKTRRDLPRGRARLYAECLEVLLEKWDMEDKRLKLPDSPGLEDKLAALKKIALHYLRQSVLEMDRPGLEDLVAPLLPNFSVSVSPEAFIRQIIERSGVLVEQRIGQFGFAHRALHDYLAAAAIVDGGAERDLLPYAAEERWREVILIAIRLVRVQARAEELLQALLIQSGENPASLALAGWSLAEGVAVKPELRVAVGEQLQTALNRVDSPGDLALLSSALLNADPQAGQDWFCAALNSPDPQLRRRVLAFVPDLPSATAASLLSLILRLLAAADETTAVRVGAAQALARFDPQLADGAVWQTLQTARQSQNDSALKAAATWAWCELGRYETLGLRRVPAGEFLLGSEPQKDGRARDNEQPQQRLYLPQFYIARFQVTVAEWRAYLEESGQQPMDKKSVEGASNHPVVYVNWREALAYAEWHGLTLPSEVEWEKAARGTDGRIYPWGDTWQAGRANGHPNSKGRTTPVGQYSPLGDSPYGCADMCGNVWDWTRSLYQKYPYDPSDGREDLNAAGSRVLRGGSFSDYVDGLRSALRYDSVPSYSGDSFGFRCARLP